MCSFLPGRHGSLAPAWGSCVWGVSVLMCCYFWDMPSVSGDSFTQIEGIMASGETRNPNAFPIQGRHANLPRHASCILLLLLLLLFSIFFAGLGR
ncbi:hypothetical protein GGS23DRAFT_586836, partial [Durotheca rogersii]|uniref:uncharacterized protein n=1 Tax=Durotheca rogersii TaxID=419775 RepID=UPI00221E41C1